MTSEVARVLRDATKRGHGGVSVPTRVRESVAQTLAHLVVERIHQFSEANDAGLKYVSKDKSDSVDFLMHLIAIALTQDSVRTTEDILKSSNAYKASLLEQASSLFQDIIEDEFDLSEYSDVWKDRILEFQTKTWND